MTTRSSRQPHRLCLLAHEGALCPLAGVCGKHRALGRGASPARGLLLPPVPRSAEFRDFLKTALDKNPETRPSAAQLLEVRPLSGRPPCAWPSCGGGRQRSAMTWEPMPSSPSPGGSVHTAHSATHAPGRLLNAGCGKGAPTLVLMELWGRPADGQRCALGSGDEGSGENSTGGGGQRGGAPVEEGQRAFCTSNTQRR